jgi:2-dehydropantoate 2-reductase
MKITIFGAGAIGGCLAARLAAVEEVDLSVIARGAHLETIRNRGLKLMGPDGERVARLRATSDPAEVGRQDYVICSLKAHQAWAAADQIAALLGPETAVVTCLNGIPWWYFYRIGGPYEGTCLDAVDRSGRQWRLIGPERAMGSVVFTAAEVTEPGVVRHLFGFRLPVGEPSGAKSERAGRLSRVLEQAGFEAPILDDIRSEIWLKLWGNLCFNPLSALTRGTLKTVATDPGTRAVARAMMAEAQAVAQRLGATFRIDIERRIDAAASVGDHRTSMLQDLEAGRVLEIDALVTAVQEMGRLVGVATPAIDTILALVQQLGRSLGLYPAYPELEAPARHAGFNPQ